MSGYEKGGPKSDWDLAALSIPTRRVALKSSQQRKGRHFIPALPIGLFDRACVLPGKSLAVYLLLWRLTKVKGASQVILTSAHLEQHGLSRHEKETALRHLEAAGLVTVERRPRRNPRVALLD